MAGRRISLSWIGLGRVRDRVDRVTVRLELYSIDSCLYVPCEFRGKG